MKQGNDIVALTSKAQAGDGCGIYDAALRKLPTIEMRAEVLRTIQDQNERNITAAQKFNKSHPRARQRIVPVLETHGSGPGFVFPGQPIDYVELRRLGDREAIYSERSMHLDADPLRTIIICHPVFLKNK